MISRRIPGFTASSLSSSSSPSLGPSRRPPARRSGSAARWPSPGPLAPTALLHKIAGEIYIEELNKANGLLGPAGRVGAARRPVQARRHAQPLREAHHGRQGRPADGALRDERHPGRDGRGPALPEGAHPPLVRHAAPGEVRDALPHRGFRARAERDRAHHGLRRAGRHRQSAQDGGDPHQQVPLRAVPVGRAPRKWPRSAA